MAGTKFNVNHHAHDLGDLAGFSSFLRCCRHYISPSDLVIILVALLDRFVVLAIHRLRATGDLGQFLGNSGLTGGIVFQRIVVD